MSAASDLEQAKLFSGLRSGIGQGGDAFNDIQNKVKVTSGVVLIASGSGNKSIW